MKALKVELPEKLAAEVDAAVQAGWFHNPQEVVRAALIEFLRHRRPELIEEFHRADIKWALEQRAKSA